MKFVKRLKLSLFYLRKAFFEYHQGMTYIYHRYIYMPKIKKFKRALDRPINHHDLSMHVLTCHRDVTMLLWSLASFYAFASVVGKFYIHNDGTLTQNDKELLKKFFPHAQIVNPGEWSTEQQKFFEAHPKVAQFLKDHPGYVLLKKLIDPYVVSAKRYRLVIDSDLLWFKDPKEITFELNNGCKNSLMMRNNDPLPVRFIGGKKLIDRLALLNSGIVVYSKENFNVKKLEEYLEKVDTHDPNTEHFIEQAGYASCLNQVKELPIDRYHIKDPVGKGTMVKHYTSPRRLLFYIEGFKYLKRLIEW